MSNKNNDLIFTDGVISGKSSTITTFLVTFFGFLGVHRFYTGYFWIGLFQLLTCGGFIVWFLIDIVAIYINKYNDKKGNPLANYNRKIAGGMIILAVIVAFIWACLYMAWIQKTTSLLRGGQISTPFDNVKQATSREIVEQYQIQTGETEPEVIIEEKYKHATPLGLNIIEDDLCYDVNGAKMICGTIINTTDKPAKNIVIKFHLFDKNKNFVSFAQAKIYNLNAKAQWEFQAPIYYNTVDSYKFFKITAQ